MKPQAWQPLPDDESLWQRFERDFEFRLEHQRGAGPAIREPAGSVTFDLSPIFHAGDQEAFDAAEHRFNDEVLEAFRRVFAEDLVVLDWQHPTYRLSPPKLVTPVRGWYLRPFPNGDYYMFLTEDMSQGTFGHPWEQTLCVFGADLVADLVPRLSTWLPVKRRATQRLSLHRVSMDDLDAFIALHGASRSVEQLTSLLREFCAVWDGGEHGYWKLVLGDRIAGFGGVKPKTWRGRPVWNLYYRIWPDLRGKGLATEMARAAISVAAQEHADWPVLVETRPDNAAAIKVAEGVGMTRHPDADGWTVFILQQS